MTPRIQPPTNPILDAALRLAAKGYAVFPCKAKAKEPLTRRGFKDASRRPDAIKRWWRELPTANIGLVPGSANQIVIDIDGDTGLATAKQVGLWPSETRRVVTGRGHHLYFQHPGGTIGNRKLGDGLDVRADAGYVLAPPSVHPSGAKYAWAEPDAQVLPLPDEISARLRGVRREGGRNNALASHLGRLRRKGATDEQLVAAALDFNAAHCDPPLDEREAIRVAESIARYPVGRGGLTSVEGMNAEFGLILLGGKTRILREMDGTTEFMGTGDFRAFMENRFIFDGEKERPAALAWLRHPQRREYQRLVFEPGRSETKGAYNLWRGWGVEPREGDCSLFLDHLREVVCGGDVELYHWVSAWFAQILQEPTRKPGTSLALRGLQGTGKSIVGNVFGKLIGSAYKQVASSRHVTGNFNAHLAECLLLHADEAFWAGDKSAEGVLKDMVTSDRMWIERKGIDQVEARNFIRLFVTSNNDWVVPAGFEERRFCVIDVSNARMQDKPYFAAIMKQMDAGGYEALLHHCLSLPIADVDLRTIPRTSALVEQKIASLTPEQGWLLDIVYRGYLPGDAIGEGVTTKQAMYDDFVRHSEKTGVRRKSIETTIGMFLPKRIKGLQVTQVTPAKNARPVPSFAFPSLKACRKQLAALVGNIDWDQPDEWRPDPKTQQDGGAF